MNTYNKINSTSIKNIYYTTIVMQNQIVNYT